MDRTAFWILLPFLMVFVVGMLWADIFTGAISTLNGRVFVVGMCAVVGALGLAFYDGERFWWAGRFVAAFIFLVYVGYVIDEWFFSGQKWNTALGSRSAASPINSVLGLIVYGVPAFWYVFTGNLSWRKEKPAEDWEYDEEDGDMDDEERRNID